MILVSGPNKVLPRHHLLLGRLMNGHLDLRELLIWKLLIQILIHLNSHISQKLLELFLHLMSQQVFHLVVCDHFIGVVLPVSADVLIGLAELLEGLFLDLFLLAHGFGVGWEEGEVADLCFFVLLFLLFLLDQLDLSRGFTLH